MKVASVMRSLHRDIGFFVIGLTLIYALSGILLTYRETGFLKSTEVVTKTIEAGLQGEAIGKAIHSRIKVTGESGGVISFEGKGSEGTYNSATGELVYKAEKLPAWLEKLNALHKTSDKKITHWFTVTYATLLAFLALSSFWMYKPRSKSFKRGVAISASGVLLSIGLLVVL